MNREWKTFGKKNPYYGVCTSEEFKNANLSEETLKSFFTSGEEHIGRVVETIRTKLDPQFAPGYTMDFGCGVGRLLIPLSKLSKIVDGLDISQGMLAEAKRNLDKLGIKNVNLIESSRLSNIANEKYDFVHSFIVFQHITVKNGMNIFEQVLDTLKKGGIGALHFTYRDSAGPFKRFKRKLLRISFFNAVKNLLKGESLNTPNMLMSEYSINKLLNILQSRGIQATIVEYTNHSGYLGIMLLFRK